MLVNVNIFYTLTPISINVPKELENPNVQETKMENLLL